MKIVILAAGIGSRLGNPLPKPLTMLKSGKTIMQQQVDNISEYFNSDDINVVVGFKKDLIMESFPDLSYIYNQNFDTTNTSKSLLKALRKNRSESVLWLNGDVVFDSNLFKVIEKYIEKDQSFVCVNNSEVGDEEVKYNLNKDGFIKDISKIITDGLGEAVGINFIAKSDVKSFINRLIECKDNDYFERGLELSIQKDNLKVLPINISDFRCLEVDFKEDLDKANKLF
ncbi:MAG: phosphocholine cytidylyltransferase family protein [Bacteroidales bacterium]|jgi:choline kinase|nr:phosphocholine cytidylyltransferase family protein [Bacteroidales bacterium]MDD4385820.1 phosphocholine cytidylyltransferase family protein [Bacteroidales bacterium]MDY0198636.1 phosphocholine cytidylyltransferase family protein [Tenuifilaceae bacterium]